MTMAIKDLETAMAYNRRQFVQTLRDDFLKGAFGEFMCRQLSLAIKKPDHWSHEVNNLLRQADDLMKQETPIKGFKDKDTAAKEAVTDLLRILPLRWYSLSRKFRGTTPKTCPKFNEFKLML